MAANEIAGTLNAPLFTGVILPIYGISLELWYSDQCLRMCCVCIISVSPCCAYQRGSTHERSVKRRHCISVTFILRHYQSTGELPYRVMHIDCDSNKPQFVDRTSNQFYDLSMAPKKELPQSGYSHDCYICLLFPFWLWM